MSRSVFILIFFLVGTTGGAVMADANTGETLSEKGNGKGRYAPITTGDSVRHIVEHPAFRGFAQLMLPREHDTRHLDTPLGNVRSFMPYHDHVDPDTVVGALNHMIDEINDGKTVFHDFYTEQQKLEDPAKENTGLFFFRGEKGAPFAIVCPGGGHHLHLQERRKAWGKYRGLFLMGRLCRGQDGRQYCLERSCGIRRRRSAETIDSRHGLYRPIKLLRGFPANVYDGECK